MYSFKDGFKHARKAAGYTQETFSKAFPNYDGSGVTLTTVRNWEQGRNTPETKTLESLCNFFGCDLYYLFNNIEYKTHNNQFIHDDLGLTERAIDHLRELKQQNSHYVDSLNFLLTSDNFDDVLFHIYNYEHSIRHLNFLQNAKKRQIESLNQISDYVPNAPLNDAIRNSIETMELSEYKLSTHFAYVIREIYRKTSEN